MVVSPEDTHNPACPTTLRAARPDLDPHAATPAAGVAALAGDAARGGWQTGHMLNTGYRRAR
jgi:hypothetical protein